MKKAGTVKRKKDADEARGSDQSGLLMLARRGLAEALEQSGKTQEAIAQYSLLAAGGDATLLDDASASGEAGSTAGGECASVVECNGSSKRKMEMRT